MGAPQAGHPLVEALDVRQPAPQHDHVRVEDVDHPRQGPRQALLVARQAGLAGRVALGGARHDALRPRQLTAAAGMIHRQARPRQIGFDAARAAAITRRQGQIITRRKRERVVAPLAGDPVGAIQGPPVHHDAGADPGAQDHPEHHRRPLPGPIHRLGQGKTVGVVGDAHLAAQQGLQVVLQRLADQAGGIRVLDEAAHPRQRPRRADPHRAPPAGLALDPLDQPHHRRQRGRVVALGRRHPVPGELLPRRAEGDHLDLGAAEVDSDTELHDQSAKRVCHLVGGPVASSPHGATF